MVVVCFEKFNVNTEIPAHNKHSGPHCFCFKGTARKSVRLICCCNEKSVRIHRVPFLICFTHGCTKTSRSTTRSTGDFVECGSSSRLFRAVFTASCFSSHTIVLPVSPPIFPKKLLTLSSAWLSEQWNLDFGFFGQFLTQLAYFSNACFFVDLMSVDVCSFVVFCL